MDKQKKIEYQRRWRKLNPDKQKTYCERTKVRQASNRATISPREKVYRDKVRKETPWKIWHWKTKDRCKAHRPYGLRGIKYLLTEEQVKFLWVRDEAWKLNKPSIDRINGGNYTIDNTQFIELIENLKKKRKHHVQKNV